MSLLEDESELLLLHNPRCSKSRAARAVRGIGIEALARKLEPRRRTKPRGQQERGYRPGSSGCRIDRQPRGLTAAPTSKAAPQANGNAKSDNR